MLRICQPGDGSYDCDGPPNRLVDLALGLTDDNPSPGELGARSVEVVEALYLQLLDRRRPVKISSPAKDPA